MDHETSRQQIMIEMCFKKLLITITDSLDVFAGTSEPSALGHQWDVKCKRPCYYIQLIRSSQTKECIQREIQCIKDGSEDIKNRLNAKREEATRMERNGFI